MYCVLLLNSIVHCGAGGKPSEQQQQQQQRGVEEAEEQSIVKGLLPCIVGIGGVALGIWLFIYILYEPPQSKHSCMHCLQCT